MNVDMHIDVIYVRESEKPGYQPYHYLELEAEEDGTYEGTAAYLSATISKTAAVLLAKEILKITGET